MRTFRVPARSGPETPTRKGWDSMATVEITDLPWGKHFTLRLTNDDPPFAEFELNRGQMEALFGVCVPP